MKNICLFLALALFSLSLSAQSQNLYNPDANAKEDISKAVKQAKSENKHVLLQIGGNWCSWCRKFHAFVEQDAELKKLVEDNFVVLRVNYSPENRNEAVLKELEFPQRFGFPVFVILNQNGTRIHTQNSGILEKDSSYDKKLVTQFFTHWTPAALDPATYTK
jgi:Thioredoxin-related protein